MTIRDILDRMTEVLKQQYDVRCELKAINTNTMELEYQQRRLAGEYSVLVESLRDELAPAHYDFATDTYSPKSPA